MNKINKLVVTSFKDIEDDWMADDFQKKLKKILKSVSKKQQTEPVDDKPKPLSAYIKFCIDKRQEVKEEHPQLLAKDITAKLGKLWNEYKKNDPKYLEENYNYIVKDKK